MLIKGQYSILEAKIPEEKYNKIAHLPFNSSRSEVEELLTDILRLQIPEKTKKYSKFKEETKESWCYAYKKVLPCLEVNTKSMIESLNSIIKSEIHRSVRLV